MAKASEKISGKKPFMVLSRRAASAWVVAIFLISGWMFGVGILVGRGTVPVQFDLDRLKRSIASLQKTTGGPRADSPAPKPAQMKEKTSLDFYEALPKNREDAEMPNLPKAPPPAPPPAKPEPAARKPAETAAPPAPPAPVKPEKVEKPEPPAAAPAGPYTVQIAAVRSEEEARQFVERLRQKGYAAHLEATAVADKGVWYRVRMGEFPTREGAAGTLQRLKKDGFESIVIPK
jgi:cell division protein FtsN